jgi:hypothetical protein
MRFFREVAGRFWRRYVAAEDPEASMEFVRQQRIDDLTVCTGLLESMRRWDEDRRLQLRELACAA